MIFVLRRRLARFRDIFDRYSWEGGATDKKSVKIRDVTEPLTMHNTVPQKKIKLSDPKWQWCCFEKPILYPLKPPEVS